jgi:hypothetical protein
MSVPHARIAVHSVLNDPLKRLRAEGPDGAAARSHAASLGLDPNDPDLPGLLLGAARRQSAVDVVLFSTRSTERLDQLTRLAPIARDVRIEAAGKFHAWLAQLA